MTAQPSIGAVIITSLSGDAVSVLSFLHNVMHGIRIIDFTSGETTSCSVGASTAGIPTECGSVVCCFLHSRIISTYQDTGRVFPFFPVVRQWKDRFFHRGCRHSGMSSSVVAGSGFFVFSIGCVLVSREQN